MRRRCLTLLAVTSLLGSLFLGLGASPASATPLQGANQFANAPLLPGAGGTFTGTTARATRQPGEPAALMNLGGASVWYRFRATTNGLIRVSTKGSSFDTILAVYRGNSFANLTLVKANDDVDGAEDRTSRVQFTGQAGVTYRIQIDGFNRNDAAPPPVERGPYSLRVINYSFGD